MSFPARIGLIVSLLVLLAQAVGARPGDWTVENYPYYELPPVLGIFDTVEPAGKIAWRKVESVTPAGDLNAAAYFPDGRSIVAGENEGRDLGRIVRWDRRAGRRVWNTRPFKYARYGGYPAVRGLATNGRFVAAFPWFRAQDKDISLAILDGRTGRVTRRLRLPSTLKGCAGRAYGRRIMLQPWRMRFAGNALYVYYKNQFGANYPGCLVVDDTWIVKWDPARGRVLWKHRVIADGIPELGVPERACFTTPNLDVAPDGRTIASGDCNGRVLLLDARTGKKKGRVPSFLGVSRAGKMPGTYRISEIAFDPARPGIAYCVVGDAGRKSLLARVNLREGKFDRRLLTAQLNDIPQLRVSPDGRLLMAGYSNLFAWDLKLRAAIAIQSGYFPRFNPRVMEMMYIAGSDLEFVRLKPAEGSPRKARAWGTSYPTMADYGGRRGINKDRRK